MTRLDGDRTPRSAAIQRGPAADPLWDAATGAPDWDPMAGRRARACSCSPVGRKVLEEESDNRKGTCDDEHYVTTVVGRYVK